MARTELLTSQKQFIDERDHRICKFPLRVTGQDIETCGSELHPERHHISAYRWSDVRLGWEVNQINDPLNLITLCKYHHQHIIHPDMQVAYRRYPELGKRAFDEMFELRRVLTEQGVPYWLTMYDELFKRVAYDGTNRMERSGQVWIKREPRRLAS